MPKNDTQLFYLLVANGPIPLGRPLPLKKGFEAELIPLGEVLLRTQDTGLANGVWVYSVDSFCILTGMSKTTFYRECKDERIDARVMRGRTVVLRDEAIAYLLSLPKLQLSKPALDLEPEINEEDA